jgi:hypothetical protein
MCVCVRVCVCFKEVLIASPTNHFFLVVFAEAFGRKRSSIRVLSTIKPRAPEQQQTRKVRPRKTAHINIQKKWGKKKEERSDKGRDEASTTSSLSFRQPLLPRLTKKKVGISHKIKTRTSRGIKEDLISQRQINVVYRNSSPSFTGSMDSTSSSPIPLPGSAPFSIPRAVFSVAGVEVYCRFAYVKTYGVVCARRED